jgi:hypothetical protein
MLQHSWSLRSPHPYTYTPRRGIEIRNLKWSLRSPHPHTYTPRRGIKQRNLTRRGIKQRNLATVFKKIPHSQF